MEEMTALGKETASLAFHDAGSMSRLSATMTSSHLSEGGHQMTTTVPQPAVPPSFLCPHRQASSSTPPPSSSRPSPSTSSPTSSSPSSSSSSSSSPTSSSSLSSSSSPTSSISSSSSTSSSLSSRPVWWRRRADVRRLLLLSLVVMAVTVAGVGVLSWRRVEYRLHIGVPQSAPIRKVRSYSTEPELSALVQSHASLALVSRLQLLDLNGCHRNVSLCQTVAVCDGRENEVLCRCRRGYYFKHRRCIACSKSCPDGHFLVNPCSASADAVCKPCTECGGSQYAAAPCTTTRDTICVDVMFPMGILPLNHSNLQDDGSPVAVSHSANVFLERLVDMEELETPMYVTNNQQIQDFVWHRSSGIDIVVGISGVFLIPEYRELDAEDDSQFFLNQKMVDQTLIDLFAKTKKKYCSHPVPDYHYLHLEVIRNRTAAARVVRCDSQDPGLPRCPPGYKDGDRYLKWDINSQCHKFKPSGASSAPLPQLRGGFNTVVCPEETSLDRSIFKLSTPATLEMMFPTPACSQHRAQCQQCLHTATCTDNKSSPACCGLSCYNSGSCHQFYSPACPPAQVECASGEVHSFTLMPQFHSMDREFACHLQYQRPAYLYNISYTLSIPAIGFQVPLQQYTARADSLRHHRHHTHHFHFMHIWHDTRMPFQPDLILRGSHAELEATKSDHMQPFVVHSLKSRADLSRRKGFFTANKGRGQYSTAVQFERPFLYSSSSWYRNGCDKNMSHIFPNQTLYRNDAVRVMAKQAPDKDRFAYEISHSQRSPYIKLSIKEKTSVLRWFQGSVAQGWLVKDSLTGRMDWVSSDKLWTLTVTGTTQDCPAILTVQVFNKMMAACVGTYDVLVACPENFTLTFNLTQTADYLPDIFVLLVNDSVSSHHLVLSSVIAPANIPVVTVSTVETSWQSAERGLAQWAPILSVLALTLAGLVVILLVYTVIRFRSSRAARGVPLQESSAQETAMLNNQSQSSWPARGGGAQSNRQGACPARTCLTLFAVLYVAYSLLFTFTASLALLHLAHTALTGPGGPADNFSLDIQRELNKSFHSVQRHEGHEAARLFGAVDTRLQACSHHLRGQNRAFLQQYQDSISHFLAYVYQSDGAIDSLAGQSIRQNTSIYTAEIEQFLLDCNRTVQSILDRFSAHFFLHAKDLARNSWLDFPREVFLRQRGDPPDRKYMSAGQLARFLAWLQVDKTDDLLDVSRTLTDRLAELKLPSPTDHLERAVTSAFDDFSTSLPPEPAVAEQTFLVLDRPPSTSPPPAVLPPNPSPSSSPDPRPDTAFLHASRVQVGEDGGPNPDHNRSSPSSQRQEQTGGEKGGVEGETSEDEDVDLMMYVMIGLFLLMDVLLIAFRMSWMVNQIRAAKAGYEDRIPTDPVSQKLLAIQTGYRLTRMQDLYQSYGNSSDNKENAMTEERERGSESEFNVYFCQSYPKSKDDILREIMAHKMSSTEHSLGHDRGPGPDTNQPRAGTPWGELWAVRAMSSACHWLLRLLVSHLLWRLAVSLVLLLLLCLLAYTADLWLTVDNLRVLVGGESAMRDLHVQVHMTNRHLSGLASHLAGVLQEHSVFVEREVALSTDQLTSTLHTQRELLLSLLQRVCRGAGSAACNLSSYPALPLPHPPAWQPCNFLPPQPQLYQELTTINLEQMVGQLLSPLLESLRHTVFSLCAVVISLVCVMFLCHAGATVARYYMLICGLVPRVQIFQISENASLMYDGDPSGHKPMQRSASWLESCESGVYVGESELDTNRDV